MPTSTVRSPTCATDGAWMDVPSAAMYAGVSLAVLSAAMRDNRLLRQASYGAAPTALVHSHAVEVWAAERESALVALAY